MRMKPGLWIKLLLAILILGALGLPVYYPFLLIRYSRWTNEDDYPRRRERYEAILATLMKLDVPNRRAAYFFVAADRDPSSLRPLKDDEMNNQRYDFVKTSRYLEVFWREDGSIVAIFFNKDLGPFGGTFGTIHSIATPSASTAGIQGTFKQVAPNWWAAHFD